ncbi:PREDICTED: uncharacterized protein LOC108567977 [Nicrophorus vespilloides]|uniref:Uncharacterized protein LOC108567977 n=1 Tax=Nicrophorus vespilloides TaxID=110193 RepID=A0ABM1NBU1_NICVS|nr:PREDICTED: uncharacterized protein LOC108567977 [Nicrophorus vespilloides]
MDLILRCLIISGKCLSKITANSIRGVYRKSIVLNDQMTVRYDNLWRVIGHHDNVLDLYSSNYEDVGLDPQAYLTFIGDKHKEEFESYLRKEEEKSSNIEEIHSAATKLRPLRKSDDFNAIPSSSNFFVELDDMHKQVKEATKILWVNSKQFVQFEKQLCAKFKKLEVAAERAKENLISMNKTEMMNLTAKMGAVEKERINLLENYGRFQMLEESVGDETFRKKLDQIREDVRCASSLLNNNLRCFTLTDARIQLKKVKYNIINANHVLHMSQKECDKIKREMVSKLLTEPDEEYETEELESELIPLPIECRIKIKQEEIKHTGKVIEINKRMFDELEQNLKVVKIIRKNDNRKPLQNSNSKNKIVDLSGNVINEHAPLVGMSSCGQKYLSTSEMKQVPNNRIEQSNVYKLIKQEQDRRKNIKVSSNYRNEDDRRIRNTKSKEEKDYVNVIHKGSRGMSELNKINNIINDYKNLETLEERRKHYKILQTKKSPIEKNTKHWTYSPILESIERKEENYTIVKETLNSNTVETENGITAYKPETSVVLNTEENNTKDTTIDEAKQKDPYFPLVTNVKSEEKIDFSENQELLIKEVSDSEIHKFMEKAIQSERNSQELNVANKEVNEKDCLAKHENSKAIQKDCAELNIVRDAESNTTNLFQRDWKCVITCKSLNDLKILDGNGIPIMCNKFDFGESENRRVRKILEALPIQSTRILQLESDALQSNSSKNLDKHFYSIPRPKQRCTFDNYDNSSFGNLRFEDFCLKDSFKIYWDETKMVKSNDDLYKTLSSQANLFADIVDADESLNNFSCMHVKDQQDGKSLLVVKEKSKMDMIEERFKRVALARTNTNLIKRAQAKQLNLKKEL